MELVLRLLCLTAGLCTVYGYALDDNDLKRALDVLETMNKEGEEKRGLHTCKGIGTACGKVFNRCCGNSSCYWEDGYSIRKEGVCKECVEEGEKCQSDSQCCAHLQCDKGGALWVDGKCQRYRRKGECYRDGQCVTDCKKKYWFYINGVCE